MTQHDHKTNDIGPPKVVVKCLRFFLKVELHEEVLGDLEEQFSKHLVRHNLTRAQWTYFYQVLHYLRPFAVKRLIHSPLKNAIMLKQNLKVSWRSLVRDKTTSWIKVGGLALGVTAALLIALWVYDEYEYDRQYDHADRIARAMQNQRFGGQIRTWFSQPMHLAPVLRDDYGTYFEEVVTSSGISNRQINWDEKKIMQSGAFMEPGISNMLSLQYLEGTPSSLDELSSVVVSQSFAKAVFGQENPMGQQLTIQNQMEVQVGGIYKDLPSNSSFANLHFIAPWELLKKTANFEARLGWGNSWFSIFTLLQEGVTFAEASAAIREEKAKHIAPERAAKLQPEIFLHPMERWHLYETFKDGQNTGGRITSIWLFGCIGFLILLLACINFTNLSTAQGSKRALEVGIRKTIGSQHSQLVGRFISESFIITLVAFVFACGLCWLFIPSFNLITQKVIEFPWGSLYFWVGCTGALVLVSLLAGSYPAFYLARFSPTLALRKQNSSAKNTSFSLRRILVTIQFVFAIGLIISTLVIVEQINFAKDRPIGYQQDNIITIPINEPKWMPHFETVRNQLMQTGYFQEIAASDVKITSTFTTNSGFNWEGKDPNLSEEFYTLRATHDFGELVGWNIKEGRDFSRAFGTDSLAFILNETAVDYMSLTDPIGTKIQWGENASNGTFEVIGVIEDMITTSPFEAVRPMIYVLHYGRFINYLNVRVDASAPARTAIEALESMSAKYDPESIFTYQFMDEQYAKKFGNEERLAKLASYFALLAIFISCIGVLGISALTADQRKKEIGIRKVLGASVYELWSMLSREVIILILVAIIFAIPLSIFFMNGWLDQYVYRIPFKWWIFGLGGFLTLLIALLTVSLHTIKAARANPGVALKSE